MVDAPSRKRIAPIDPNTTDTPLLLVDHHKPDDLLDIATYDAIDTAAPATSVLVSNLLQSNDLDISPTGAQALVAGIPDDTDFRAVVMPDIQPLVCELLATAQATETDLATLWEHDTPWSEQMATAKAIVRANGYKAGQRLLLITQVGGHERAAADLLLDGAADIGIVLSSRDDHTRIVASTTDQIGMSLPEDVLKPLTSTLGGNGEGHATAGVAKVESMDTGAVETAVIEQIERYWISDLDR